MKLSTMIAQLSSDKVPGGWKTVEQLAKEEDVCVSGSFRHIVKEAVRVGILERKDYRIFYGGQRRTVAHYRRVK